MNIFFKLIVYFVLAMTFDHFPFGTSIESLINAFWC